MCPNFDTLPYFHYPGFYVLCRFCRQWYATKIVNSKAEKISKLTVNSQVLLNYFSPEKKIIFVNYEVRAGCPKLGHTTMLLLLFLSRMYSVMQSDGNSFCGDVVLDSFSMVYSDENNIKDHKYKKRFF